jgi:hypothetical protein
MTRDRTAVAEAIRARLAELDPTQAELARRSRLAPMTVRELPGNTIQRRGKERYHRLGDCRPVPAQRALAETGKRPGPVALADKMAAPARRAGS